MQSSRLPRPPPRQDTRDRRSLPELLVPVSFSLAMSLRYDWAGARKDDGWMHVDAVLSQLDC